MLLSETVEVTINYKNVNRYKELGYEFETFVNKDGKLSVKRGTVISVKVSDLDINNGSKITYECDYCKNKITVSYCDYMKHYPNGVKEDKDACRKCSHLKVKEKLKDKYGENITSPFSIKEIRDKRDATVREKYGVDNVFQLEEVKDKIVDYYMENYGVKHNTQIDEYKEKTRLTNLEKYGCENVSQNKDIIQKIKDVQIERYGDLYVRTQECQEKIKHTNNIRYGVDCVFQDENVKEQILDYNIKTYGVAHPMKLDRIKKDRIPKMLKTKHRNGSGTSSRQQDYLNLVYKGEINYPIDRCSLDIALLDSKTYFEYDGSGHDLSIKFNEITEEEFNKKEMARKYYLFSKGWREIRIISKKDYLPQEDILLNMQKYSMDWLSKGHKWIKFNIDNGTVETSEFIDEYDFGSLRRIKECDLELAE